MFPVSFDLNSREAVWDAAGRAAEAARSILPHVDWVLCGAEEGEALFGPADPATLGQTIRDMGVAGVVVRVGTDGAWLIDDDVRLIPIDALETGVRDEVGAGDAFAAGFVAGILGGRSAPASVSLAHALAARALRGTGDWETLPRMSELR